MFLSHIQNNKINQINFNQILKIKILIKKLKNKVFFLTQIKENKKLRNLKLFLPKKKFFSNTQEDLVKYVIGISLLKTNSILYVTNIKGQLKFFCSAGLVGLTGKQKIKKPLVLINLLKIFIKKAKFLNVSPVALHLKNFNKYYELFVLNILKTKFFIKIIKNFTVQPHNGCRPKKIKKKKRKKILFI
jgi:ribosomal protein S11